MKEFFNLMFSYIKKHVWVIVTLTLSVGVFFTVFSLYSLPVESVAYACMLCIFIFLVVGAIRFSSYYRKYVLLKMIKTSISTGVYKFPETADKAEQIYHEIIDLLIKLRADTVSEKDRVQSEMTDYYTMWAHQIKTPIAAASLLLQSSPAPQGAELSEQLFKIEQYVDMVLGYLRSESMSGDLIIKKYPIDGIVKQAVRKYAKSFIRKKLTLEYTDIDLCVLTDEKWMVFVVEQILSNSLKYTSEGKISIYTEQGKNGISLVIEDTGIGIQPEDLPRIGERGFTGYNGHKDKKSTGIGLYLCKKILKKLSCEIYIESKVGIGTKVIISFPCNVATLHI